MMRPEPPLIERARRIGWTLLAVTIAALVAAKWGAPTWRPWLHGIAIGTGLLGLLAIINVALVRSLYAQIGKAAAAQDQHPDTGTHTGVETDPGSVPEMPQSGKDHR